MQIGDQVYPFKTPAGVAIDPATATKQDTMITLLGGLGGSNYASQFLADSGDANIFYLGLAAIGSLASAASWQIKKYDFTDGVVLTWCDGDADFDNIYDNRESLTYS